MKDIILITNNHIIKHIISLIAKKNDLELLIVKNCSDCQKSKIIIIDEEDNFSNNLFEYSNLIILLTNNQINDISKYCTIIKKPFLPKTIEKAIMDNLSNIKPQQNKEEEKKINLEDEADDLVEYLDNLDKNEEDNEDVLISKDSLDNGGVLDTKELNELSKLVDEDIKTITPQIDEDEANLDELSKIIDNAIEELKYENNELEKNDYKLILNNFTFKELKPLLTKLDQEIIDKLVKGKEINLTLKVEDDK